MIEWVCEFIVKEGAKGHFELMFGPGGDWSGLFARSPGFRGLTLLRETKDPRRYLVIELWRSESEREQLLTECQGEYAAMKNRLSDWLDSEAELGTYRALAEATVQSRNRGRSRSRRSRP